MKTGERPVLVLSRAGLSSRDDEALSRDYTQGLGSDLLSVIISIKMMHVYFSHKGETLDYRPHRGPFSGLTTAPYRLGKTDRAECVFRLTAEEQGRLQQYISNIRKSPATVLGTPHGLSLVEPDFTVRSHSTNAKLEDNRLLDRDARHNCLTWLTTAPIGDNGEQFLKLFGMKECDLFCEAHSYIVAFHEFLLHRAPKERVPLVALWTQDPLEVAVQRVKTDPDSLRRIHTRAAPAPTLEPNRQLG